MENISENFKDVLEVWNSLSKKEQRMIYKGEYDESPYVKYRRVIKDRDKSIAFLEIYSFPEDEKTGYIVVATNPNYRKKGYVKMLVTLAEEENIKNFDRFLWQIDLKNQTSKEVSLKLGYNLISKKELEKILKE